MGTEVSLRKQKEFKQTEKSEAEKGAGITKGAKYSPPHTLFRRLRGGQGFGGGNEGPWRRERQETAVFGFTGKKVEIVQHFILGYNET